MEYMILTVFPFVCVIGYLLFSRFNNDFDRGVVAFNRKEYNQALYYFDKVKNKDSWYYLGLMYLNGYGVSVDIKKAVLYLEKSARLGNKEALYKIGMMYFNGEFIKKDRSKAFIFLIQIADIYINASYLVGIMILEKSKLFSYSDVDAYKFIIRAAFSGMKEAQYQVGILLSQGRGISKNIEESLIWFQKAKEQGHQQASVKYKDIKLLSDSKKGNKNSQYLLGMEYLYNSENYQTAIYWLEQSAKNGLNEAQYTLGVLFYEGKYTEKNYKKAVYWFEKAAKKGYPKAQYFLGSLYCYGEGVLKDLYKAAKWLRKANEQGENVSELWNRYELWKY